MLWPTWKKQKSHHNNHYSNFSPIYLKVAHFFCYAKFLVSLLNRVPIWEFSIFYETDLWLIFILTTTVEPTPCVAPPCVQLNWSAVVLNSWCLSNRVRSPTFYWCHSQDSANINLVAIVRRVSSCMQNCTHIYLAHVHRDNLPTVIGAFRVKMVTCCPYILYISTLVWGQSQCPYINWCCLCEDDTYYTSASTFTLKFSDDIGCHLGTYRHWSFWL